MTEGCHPERSEGSASVVGAGQIPRRFAPRNDRLRLCRSAAPGRDVRAYEHLVLCRLLRAEAGRPAVASSGGVRSERLRTAAASDPALGLLPRAGAFLRLAGSDLRNPL